MRSTLQRPVVAGNTAAGNTAAGDNIAGQVRRLGAGTTAATNSLTANDQDLALGRGRDTVSISAAARALLAAEVDDASASATQAAASGATLGGDDQQTAAPRAEEEELSEGEQEQVRELEARDREVRAHEQAHKAAAGDLAVGGPSYTYQTGPDGKRYAIGGEVKIQLRQGRTPEETARNMERAIRAANAPQSPSGPDRAVAAKAAQLAANARRDQAGADDDPLDPSRADASQTQADGIDPAEERDRRGRPRIDLLA
ncbi:MAG: putative metalloprotease CJM1_0395 family protein [Planctomycetota bacterium]